MENADKFSEKIQRDLVGTRRGGGAETLSFPAKAAAGQDGSRPQDWARAGLYNIVTHNSWKEETRNKKLCHAKRNMEDRDL